MLRQPGYPFCVELTARKLSADDGLEVWCRRPTPGSAAAPYGTGCHPYLTPGTPLVDECELELPAAQWLAADDRHLVGGPPT